MLEISVDIAKDTSSSEAALAELQALMRKALSETNKIDLVDISLSTEASVDPATLQQLTTLISAAAGTVGAGATLLVAIRKFVSAAGALIRTVRVEISGRLVPLDQVTEAQVDRELARG